MKRQQNTKRIRFLRSLDKLFMGGKGSSDDDDYTVNTLTSSSHSALSLSFRNNDVLQHTDAVPDIQAVVKEEESPHPSLNSTIAEESNVPFVVPSSNGEIGLLDIDTVYFVDYSSEIGRGHKTVVRKCIHRKTGERCAIKSIPKSCARSRQTSKHHPQVEELCNEASILKTLDHPNIVRFHEIYQDDNSFHSVLELCKGGELYEKVLEKAATLKLKEKKTSSSTPSKKKKRSYYLEEESKIATILHQVLDAVAYCHSQNVVHRDLKLENIVLCDKKQSTTKVKIIDFGLSTRLVDDDGENRSTLTEKVGTNYYVAPEVLRHSYTAKADVWSIGVIAYALFGCTAPFVGATNQEIYDKILSDQPVSFENGSVWEDVSPAAKDFVLQCLEKDASKRPSAEELLSHEWFLQQRQQQHQEQQKAPSRLKRFKQAFRK